MAFANNRQLLNGATATNSAPANNTVGVSLPGGRFDKGAVVVESTAGSGTMTVTLKLWVYCAALDTWAPLGAHATAASRGLLNAANAIGESGSDSIKFAESVSGLANFDRAYLEVTAIGGTSTAIDAWLVLRKR